MNTSSQVLNLPNYAEDVQQESIIPGTIDDDFYQALDSFSYDVNELTEPTTITQVAIPNNNNISSTTTPSTNCTTTNTTSLHNHSQEESPAFNFLTATTDNHHNFPVDINKNQQFNMSTNDSITTPTCGDDEAYSQSPNHSPINKTSTVQATPMSISAVTGRPLYPRQRHTGSTRCANCNITHTPMWRKGMQGEILCNKCGLYLTRHGKERPLNLQDSEDVAATNSSQEKPAKKRRSKVANESKCEKKERKKSEKTKRSLEKSETKSKKKTKGNGTNFEVNTSQSSPILSSIEDCNQVFKIPSPNQTVSNQLVASPTNSCWNATNSPVHHVINSPSCTPSQTPIMINKNAQPVMNLVPNDWILNQLRTCTQPVMQKQVWPSYTVQQSAPTNTIIYSTESNQYYQPWNNCFVHDISPTFQSEDQLFNSLFTTNQFLNQSSQQNVIPYNQCNNQTDLFTLKLDQHDLISELLSDYQFIQ